MIKTLTLDDMEIRQVLYQYLQERYGKQLKGVHSFKLDKKHVDDSFPNLLGDTHNSFVLEYGIDDGIVDKTEEIKKQFYLRHTSQFEVVCGDDEVVYFHHTIMDYDVKATLSSEGKLVVERI